MAHRCKVLIVDDERLARRELRAMLAAHASIEIVGEAGSAAQAAQLIQQTAPDALFLDVQMPGASGFDLLDAVPITFKVIFVTAHDAYAIRAFEVNALDYLLKPIQPVRLAAAIERLAATPPLPAAERPLKYEDRLWLDLGRQSRFLRIREIVCLRAAGDYSELLTANGVTSLTFKPLKDWEERLPGDRFLRIHRSTIINLDFLDHIETRLNRTRFAHLKNHPAPLPISRRYAAALKFRFS